MENWNRKAASLLPSFCVLLSFSQSERRVNTALKPIDAAARKRQSGEGEREKE